MSLCTLINELQSADLSFEFYTLDKDAFWRSVLEVECTPQAQSSLIYMAVCVSAPGKDTLVLECKDVYIFSVVRSDIQIVISRNIDMTT